MQYLVELLSGATGAALVAGVFGLIQNAKNKNDSTKKALRYLMLYVIQERGKQHLRDGKISLEDRRMLHAWHDVYHGELGGNGDAAALMSCIDALPLDVKED